MEPLLDINDVERITKIKKATLRRYVLLKQIPYSKVIKAIRFQGSEIDEWVKNNGSLKGLERRDSRGNEPKKGESCPPEPSKNSPYCTSFTATTKPTAFRRW
jgi:predicted DNA-binding transcriptional regulator AlpA